MSGAAEAESPDEVDGSAGAEALSDADGSADWVANRATETDTLCDPDESAD